MLAKRRTPVFYDGPRLYGWRRMRKSWELPVRLGLRRLWQVCRVQRGPGQPGRVQRREADHGVRTHEAALVCGDGRDEGEGAQGAEPKLGPDSFAVFAMFRSGRVPISSPISDDGVQV